MRRRERKLSRTSRERDAGQRFILSRLGLVRLLGSVEATLVPVPDEHSFHRGPFCIVMQAGVMVEVEMEGQCWY